MIDFRVCGGNGDVLGMANWETFLHEKNESNHQNFEMLISKFNTSFLSPNIDTLLHPSSNK
jgi:hypothetical protein